MLGLSRNSKYYDKKQPKKDEKVKEAIELVLPGCRKGRKKIIRMVQKKHPEIGASRIRRVYTNAGLSLWAKLGKRQPRAVANPLPICHQVNEEWSVDFMSDALENGRKMRVFNAIDNFSRCCISSKVSFSIPARMVIEYLEQAIECNGKPQSIRSDNGPEFRSKRFQLWMKDRAIKWEAIQPGKPQQNACIERFNRTFREDVLDTNIFTSLKQAQKLADAYLKEYNEIRPHEGIGNITPQSRRVA